MASVSLDNGTTEVEVWKLTDADVSNVLAHMLRGDWTCPARNAVEYANGRSTGERECLEVAAEKYTEETGEVYTLP